MADFEEESGNQGAGEGADGGGYCDTPRNVRMSVGPLGSGEHPGARSEGGNANGKG
jgi:hypothetical protein